MLIEGRQQGFSLIELMVAITVLSILMLVGIPAFQSWVSNAKVRTIADGIQNGLHLAQAEASRRNRQVTFSLITNANGPQWRVATVVPPGTAMTDPTTGATEVSQVIQTAFLGNVSSGVSITPNPTTATTLTFNSFGFVVGGNALTSYAITKTGADHPLNVTVSVGGRIRACDPAFTLATSPEGC